MISIAIGMVERLFVALTGAIALQALVDAVSQNLEDDRDSSTRMVH